MFNDSESERNWNSLPKLGKTHSTNMNEFKCRVVATDSELSEAESKIYPGRKSKILIKKWDFDVFKKPSKTTLVTNSTEILNRPFKRMNEKNYRFYAESYVVPENETPKTTPKIMQPTIPLRQTIKVNFSLSVIYKTSKTLFLRRLNRYQNPLMNIGRFHPTK